MFRKNETHTQQTLFDSTQWMDAKIREKLKNSWAPIFYEDVFCRIDEKPFSVLYSATGKPNFPVNIMLSLEYIKHMKDCSDLELLDDFYFDYLVNYALGIRTLGEKSLSERTLYYFRERVYSHCLKNPGGDDLLFGQFAKLVKDFSEKAAVFTGEQRSDTTLFMSNIKKAGRMSLAYDVLAKAVKKIPEEKRPESLSDALKPDFKTNTLYRAKSSEGGAKLALLLNLCHDALRLLESLPATAESEEARIAGRFLNEQSVIEGGKAAPRPKSEIPSGSLQSAHDEGATYRKKGRVAQSGYALELSETCGGGNPFQLITDYAVRPNNAGDAGILAERIPVISKNTGCSDMYADGAFHSEEVHEKAEAHGIEIHLTNMTGAEPSKKLPASLFEIDEKTGVIKKCPAGRVPSRAGKSVRNTAARFPHEVCGNCEHFGRCYSVKQAKECAVRIPLKTLRAAKTREAVRTGKRENSGRRAGIEGSNSALKRKGLAKLRVRGKNKVAAVCGLKVTVQNIKRFIKYKQKENASKKNGIPAAGRLCVQA